MQQKTNGGHDFIVLNCAQSLNSGLKLISFHKNKTHEKCVPSAWLNVSEHNFSLRVTLSLLTKSKNNLIFLV